MAEPASERNDTLRARLSALGGCALCTHGGIAEGHARFIPNYQLNDTYAERAARGGLRNFYIFDFAINGVVI
jgi:phosphonoacetate hydrolase